MEGFEGHYGRGDPHFSQSSMDFPGMGLRFSESETSQFVLFDQAGTDGVIYSERMVPVAYDVPEALGLNGESNLEMVLTSAGLQDQVCDLEIYKQAMAVAFDEFEKSRVKSRPFDSNERQSLATSSSTWHENTEDLNALMDSEDEPELNSESVTSGLTQDCNTGDDELEIFEGGYLSSEGETSEGGRSHLQSRNEFLSVGSKRFRKSRRRMIRNKIQLLKNILPGGQQMETTSVLEETIRYIRALQAMVGGFDQQPASKMGAQGF